MCDIVVMSDVRRVGCVAVWGKQMLVRFFFFQAEDGIRDLVRSRGLGDVYKRQNCNCQMAVIR